MRDWIQGVGYIKLWEQLHRAEENFILVAPLRVVIAEAWYDELRLQDSNIPNHNVLLACLREAIRTATAQLQFQPDNPPAAADNPPAAAGNPPAAAWITVDEFTVREGLRQIRRAINEFRDGRRTGLVQARNRLLRTVTLTGLMTFLLVGLAALVGTDHQHLIAGTVFYLIGAIIGLFNQLYLDANTETATEDYGLATARLVYTPLLSGLAALGGVLIIPVLSVLVNSSTGGAIDQQALAVPALSDIFSLHKRPFGPVLAAIFGLSPIILISRLQQEAERYKADLRSSEPSSQRSGAPLPP